MLSIYNKALSITYRRLCSSYPTLWAMQLVARTFECECFFFRFSHIAQEAQNRIEIYLNQAMAKGKRLSVRNYVN